MPQGIWTSTSHRLTSFDLIVFGFSVSPPGVWILALPCDAAFRNITSFSVFGVELLLEFALSATAHSQGSGCQRDGVCTASIDVGAMPLPVERVIYTLDLHEQCVSSRFEIAVESPVEFAGVRVVPAFDLGKPRKFRPAWR